MKWIAWHRNTKRAEVLRELFEALGNDPFVIAECLARPILAERILSRLSGHAGVEAVCVRLHRLLAAASAPTSRLYKLPEIAPLDCGDDTWTATSTVNAPDARQFHTAVWTGSEMVIWGGL